MAKAMLAWLQQARILAGRQEMAVGRRNERVYVARIDRDCGNAIAN